MERNRSRAMRILTNPKKVFASLERLLQEWYDWRDAVAKIKDHEYDRNRCTEVYADGEENMHRHSVLQEKTLTFMDNNIENHGFVFGVDNSHCDRTDLRLSFRVKHRIQELEVIKARLEYAKVPEAYWHEKGKELVDRLAKSPDKSVEIAALALKMGL